MENEKALQTSKDVSKNIALLNYKDALEVRIAKAEVLIQSNVVPIKETADLLVALEYGEALGIPPAMAVSELYPINGRITTGVHILEALLLKNPNISYCVVEDAVEVFHYHAKGGFKVVLSSKELQDGIMANKYEVVKPEFISNPSATYENGKIYLIKANPPYMVDSNGAPFMDDRRTTISFIRKDKGIEVQQSYYLHEAFQSNNFQTKQGTWGKYTRDMMYSRLFGRLARRYGGDICKNIFTKEEMGVYGNASIEDAEYQEL
jgi:hypothetical protein